jgi:hypothetical protein
MAIASTSKKLLIGLIFLCAMNFVVFVTIGAKIGGSAENGKILNGHYFVGSHGEFTEVTSKVFSYSRIHGQSVWITHPLGMLSLIVYWVLEKWFNRPKSPNPPLNSDPAAGG